MAQFNIGRFFNTLRRISTAALIVAIAVAVMVLADIPTGGSADQPEQFRKDTLHIKLRADSGVSLSGGQFVGGPADQTGRLNDLLNDAGKVKADKLVGTAAKTDLQKKLQDSLANYYKLKLNKDADIQSLAAELKALNIVEAAYGQPTAAPAPSPNFTALQNYLQAAPQGIDANIAKTYPGGTGNRVQIVDIEYSWNANHEDLSKARTALVANGTPVDPFANNNHGTAVIGQMVADDNGFGVTGAVYGAGLKLVNVNNAERGYDPAGALNAAAALVTAGDVVVIEQQTWGPTPETYDFVPLEWLPEVYDAIRVLTANGVIVVEAGGNGNQNLNDSTYYGSPFPMGKPDSGAIIVGGAYNCTGSARLSRYSASNYGSRVNLQGPAECVTTTGYGVLYSADGENAFYTDSFSGTSSATPIVAAAAAALSSAYEERYGSLLSPAQIRERLIRNSTPQNTANGTLAGNIGPYPDLSKVLAEINVAPDTTPPSVPQNLRVVLNSKGKPVLSWNASTDNVKVASYRIYRNGVYRASTTSLQYTDSNVARRTTYSYQVAAVDSAGNISALSPAVTIRTR